MILGYVMILPYLEVSGWESSVDDFYVHNELTNIYNIVSGNASPVMENYVIDQFIDNVGKDDLLYVKFCKGGLDNLETSCVQKFPKDGYNSLEDIKTRLRGPLNTDKSYGNDLNLVQYQQLTAEKSQVGETSVYLAEAIIYVGYSEDSLYNILKTLLVMAILVFGTVNFQRDAQKLVLDPINRMVTVVHTLSENPLANTSALAVAHEEEKGDKDYEHYETILLEKTIVKIGSLLQIGFGAAGAAIIGKNMKAGALNPMVPGKMITSIYGFCDIRNFTDTTECLQEEVMVYVNKLGFIVHGATNDYYGMANKNVGDAFLLSWKICDDLLPGFNEFEEEPNEAIRIRAAETVRVSVKGVGTVDRQISPTEMADSALAAFLKCLVDLDNANTGGSLTEYLKHTRVVKR